MSAHQANIVSAMESATITEPVQILDAVSSTKTVDPAKTLNGLIPEIRDMILDLLLADPEKPDFEAAEPTTKYIHYLSMLFVNKNLGNAMCEAIKRAKDLVVVSSDFPGFTACLSTTATPIIADHAVHKVKYHVMRIHVKSPGMKKPIACSILMRKADLEGLAKQLRCFSLCCKHLKIVPLLHANSEGGVLFSDPKQPPRMSMIIRFEKPGGEDLSAKVKASLLFPLQFANKIGKIKILGEVDDSVLSILPGHDEMFRPRNMAEEDHDQWNDESQKYFMKNRADDGKDYLTLMTWIMEQGHKAKTCNNFSVARERYGRAVFLLQEATELNLIALEDTRTSQPHPHTKIAFHSEVGRTECCMSLGLWNEAAEALESAQTFDGILQDAVLQDDEDKICRAHLATLQNIIKKRIESKDFEPWAWRVAGPV